MPPWLPTACWRPEMATMPELPMFLVDASLDPGQMAGQTALPLPAGLFLTDPGEQMTLADELGRDVTSTA